MSPDKTLSSLLISLMLTATASAQVFVIGTGLGADCYNKTANNYASFRDADETCTRALREETMTLANRAATFVNRGVLRMRNGDYHDARSDYASAMRIQPDLAEIYLNDGAALIYMKEFAAALDPLNKSLDLNVTEAYAAHYNRAIARENTGDVPGAYADFQRALELNPGWDLAIRQLQRFEITASPE